MIEIDVGNKGGRRIIEFPYYLQPIDKSLKIGSDIPLGTQLPGC